MPPPIAPIALPPLVFHGMKLAFLMKKSPTIAMKPSATNFMTVVTIWTDPISGHRSG